MFHQPRISLKQPGISLKPQLPEMGSRDPFLTSLGFDQLNINDYEEFSPCPNSRPHSIETGFGYQSLDVFFGAVLGWWENLWDVASLHGQSCKLTIIFYSRWFPSPKLHRLHNCREGNLVSPSAKNHGKARYPWHTCGPWDEVHTS